MKRYLVVLALLLAGTVRAEEKAVELSFRTQEIEKDLGIGYAVLLEDINDDGKKDIVVVDKTRVVWYENPGDPRRQAWKRHVIDTRTFKLSEQDIEKLKAGELLTRIFWIPADLNEAGEDLIMVTDNAADVADRSTVVATWRMATDAKKIVTDAETARQP